MLKVHGEASHSQPQNIRCSVIFVISVFGLIITIINAIFFYEIVVM